MMERLTMRIPSDQKYWLKGLKGNLSLSGDWEDQSKAMESIILLGEYEDTGLTPEEINEIVLKKERLEVAKENENITFEKLLLEAEIESLRLQRQDLRAAFVQANKGQAEKITRLVSENDSLTEENKSLKEENAKLEGRLKDLQEFYNIKSTQLSARISEVVNLEKEVFSLKKKNKALFDALPFWRKAQFE